MSDALPLPPRPHLDYYRTLAADLRDAAARDAVHAWATRWIDQLAARMSLERFGVAESPARVAEWVASAWRRFVHRQPALASRAVQLSDAQFFLARLHGFDSWPRFAHHVETMADAGALTTAFESAVDAIVDGDLAALRRLLDAHPGLTQVQSTREHHSTLLHYVAANGVEDFRQKTPPNIVAIAELLLDRGADVNAESDAYRGHSTTLGLAATSIHPENAGVQIPLLDLLLARGANIEQRGQAGNGHGAVLGCLANGQGRAARYLADRGATLDLEGAAGVGRVDVLATYFDERGALTNGATAAQLESALMYAAGYGRADAVRFLLARGANPNAHTREGQAALHWTTYGPHLATAELLIDAGATVDVRDTHSNTPLDWAVRQWMRASGEDRELGYAMIARFVAAGAAVDVTRYDERTRASLTGDARMRAIFNVRDPAGGEPQK
jgi:hypothetical protein